MSAVPVTGVVADSERYRRGKGTIREGSEAPAVERVIGIPPSLALLCRLQL